MRGAVDWLAHSTRRADNSVLVAFGEIATLAAGVLGIDAIYTNKLQKIVAELKKDNPKEQSNG